MTNQTDPSLTVVVLAGADMAGQVAQARLSLSRGVVRLLPPDADLAALPEGATERVLALCTTAVTHMAAAMEVGLSPAQAHADCTARTRAVLDLLRRMMRGRAVAAYAAPALAQSKGLCAQVGPMLGLELFADAPGIDQGASLPGAAFRMLAAHMLRADPVLRRLAAELDGTCVPLEPTGAEGDTEVDPQAVFDDLATGSGSARVLIDELAAARLCDARSAQDRIDALDAARHAEASAHADRNAALQTEAGRLQQAHAAAQDSATRQMDRLRAEADRALAARDRLRAELETLLLHDAEQKNRADALQSEADRLQQAHAEQKQRADALQSEADRLQQAHAEQKQRADALVGSRSWRLTRPLRAVSETLGPRRRRDG